VRGGRSSGTPFAIQKAARLLINSERDRGHRALGPLNAHCPSSGLRSVDALVSGDFSLSHLVRPAHQHWARQLGAHTMNGPVTEPLFAVAVNPMRPLLFPHMWGSRDEQRPWKTVLRGAPLIAGW
jgi:hypothetical protein